MNQTDRVQQATDALAAASGLSPVAAKRMLREYDTRDLIASVASEGVGGGSAASVVSCVLARDNSLDIRTVGDHPILWDGLYDNYWSFNTLTEIPTGLGLTFTFNGSSPNIATDEAGVWAFTWAAARNPDNDWVGSFEGWVGVFPWNDLTPFTGQVIALPSAVTLTPKITTSTQAAAGSYSASNVYLLISRLA